MTQGSCVIQDAEECLSAQNLRGKGSGQPARCHIQHHSPAKTLQKGSTIIGSAKNMVRSWHISVGNVCSLLDPALTYMDLKSYLDSSLNLDVVVKQVKSINT